MDLEGGRNSTVFDIVHYDVQKNQSIPESMSTSIVILQIILFKILIWPVVIFGICGNLLNIIILSKRSFSFLKRVRSCSTLIFLISMSIMNLLGLCFYLIQLIFELVKTSSFLTGAIFVYYSVYIKYV